MIVLNVKDRKLVNQLEVNGRQPNTFIGKMIGLKPDVVAYRINRLEKEGVLKGTICYVNFHKLGYTDFGVYISLKYSMQQKESQLVEYLKRHTNVSYLARVGGNYNFIVGLLAQDSISLHHIIKELKSKFSGLIDQFDIVTRISLQHFLRKYLLDTKAKESLPYFGGELEKVQLDDLDKKIITHLTQDGRAKIVDIATKLKEAPSTIISRVRRLEKEKIITGYYPIISPGKFGFQAYNLLVRTGPIDEIEERKLMEFCEKHPHVIWTINTLGAWDYEIGVEVENQEKLQEVISQLRENLPRLMKIDFLAIFDTLKYSLYPF